MIHEFEKDEKKKNKIEKENEKMIKNFENVKLSYIKKCVNQEDDRSKEKIDP